VHDVVVRPWLTDLGDVSSVVPVEPATVTGALVFCYLSREACAGEESMRTWLGVLLSTLFFVGCGSSGGGSPSTSGAGGGGSPGMSGASSAGSPGTGGADSGGSPGTSGAGGGASPSASGAGSGGSPGVSGASSAGSPSTSGGLCEQQFDSIEQTCPVGAASKAANVQDCLLQEREFAGIGCQPPFDAWLVCTTQPGYDCNADTGCETTQTAYFACQSQAVLRTGCVRLGAQDTTRCADAAKPYAFSCLGNAPASCTQVVSAGAGIWCCPQL
jgi:hypothetical protein